MESMLSDHKCCIFKVDPCILNMHHNEVFRCLQNGNDPNGKLGLNSSHTSHPDSLWASINHSAGVQQAVVVGLSRRSKKVDTGVGDGEPGLGPTEPV